MPYRVIIGLPRWQLGGPHIFAERLVRGLSSLGHEASILLTESGTRLVNESGNEYPLPQGLPYNRLPAGDEDSWGQRFEALERYLEERAPCFYLMLHDWRNNGIAPRLSRRIRLIGLVQADNALEINQAARLGEWWDAIVAVSEPIQFKLASQYPHLAPRLTTISNAVPTIQTIPPKPTGGPLQIAYSGELRQHQKRLDDIIEIANQLAKRDIQFKLTFFGDGPHRRALEEQSRELRAKGLVGFAGRLSGDHLLDALSDQEVFLLTSEFEGLSIALLEAMSRGCVPVVSRLASQSLIIREGYNGLAAKVGDIDTFVQQLQLLATDQDLRKLMAKRAFATITDGGYSLEDMLSSYLTLFDKIGITPKHGGFLRRRSTLSRPPRELNGVSILPLSNNDDFAYYDACDRWPDRPQKTAKGTKNKSDKECLPLEKHKVLVASNPSMISGVDVFASHLVRGLRQRGIDARLHGRLPIDGIKPIGLAADLPFIQRPIELDADYLGWKDRWNAMIKHLESMAPCIYVPNYDIDFSCIAPSLPPGVHVIGIGHSDDPWHYEHLCRIGHGCDAIVGVSCAITDHLAALAPNLSSRVSTIHYGIPLPKGDGVDTSTQRSSDPKAPLKIVYTGRLVRRQKRALDIVSIARTLRDRDVLFEMIVVGDGDLRPAMERAGADLILDRSLWFTGAQPNDSVLTFLSTCDAFLMPSAFEGLSVAMLEAMSRGVVPVVSDIRSGVPDVIEPGVNGLIAPIGDVNAFADHFEWLWKHPDERRLLSSAAAETIRSRFAIDTMTDQYTRLLQSVVSKPITRPCGAAAPPDHLAIETSWTRWAHRIAVDPAASVKRVSARLEAYFKKA